MQTYLVYFSLFRNNSNSHNKSNSNKNYSAHTLEIYLLKVNKQKVPSPVYLGFYAP